METKNQKKVLVFGTFDLFHKGHEYFFKEARKEGDQLFVVVARDKNVNKIKGIDPIQDQDKRMEEIRKCGFVDEVILGSCAYSACDVIEKIKPDVICLGYDQKTPEKFEEKIKDLKKDVKIVRIDSHDPHIHKSTIIRKDLEKNNDSHK